MANERIAPQTGAAAAARVVDYLGDAVVELEVWRQNARTPAERLALHRVTALLNQAAGELRGSGTPDPAQATLPLAHGADTR